MWAEDGLVHIWGCARVCTTGGWGGRGGCPGAAAERLCGRLRPVQKPARRLSFAGSPRAPASSARSAPLCPPPPYFLRCPTTRPRDSLRGRGAARQVEASRPPGPRAGEGERGRADGGVGRVGGGRGRAGRGVLASRRALGAAAAAALLPAAAGEAAPRPASSCLLAARGCRAARTREEAAALGARRASRSRVSVSRPASGATGTGDSRLGRVGGDQPGPRAGVLGLGCLRASLGRLGQLSALHTHPGDLGGCTRLATEDGDRSPQAKARGSGPLSGERARSRATTVLGRVG